MVARTPPSSVPTKQEAARTPTPPKPAQKLYTTNVQNDWYERNVAHPVSLRLMDGTRLSGLLTGYDAGTIALRVQGYEEPVLISKHAIALSMRCEEGMSRERDQDSGIDTQAGKTHTKDTAHYRGPGGYVSMHNSPESVSKHEEWWHIGPYATKEQAREASLSGRGEPWHAPFYEDDYRVIPEKNAGVDAEGHIFDITKGKPI
jgi:sRNA-binding regulator protein Hfq